MTKINNNSNCNRQGLSFQNQLDNFYLPYNLTNIASSLDCSKMIGINRGSSDYIYYSSDYGENWVQKTSSGSKYWYSCCSSRDGSFLAATVGFGSGYIYTSTDYGETWVERTGAGQRVWNAISCSDSGKYVIVGSAGGTPDCLYTSSNYGSTWTQSISGNSLWVSSISCSSDGSTIFFSTSYGASDTIRKSSNYGSTWSIIKNSTGEGFASLTVSDDARILVTTERVNATTYIAHLSKDSGSSFQQITALPTAYWLYTDCSLDGKILLVGPASAKPYYSENFGDTWTQINTSYNFTSTSYGMTIAKDGSTIYFVPSSGQNVGLKMNKKNSYFPITNYNISNVSLSSSSQNLSTASTAISGMNATLAHQGIYEIEATIYEDISTVTNSASANYSVYQLYTTTGASSGLVVNSEQIGIQIPIISSSIKGYTGGTKTFKWLFSNNQENNTIKIYGKINSSVTGNWSIKSNTTGRSLLYTRLLV